MSMPLGAQRDRDGVRETSCAHEYPPISSLNLKPRGTRWVISDFSKLAGDRVPDCRLRPVWADDMYPSVSDMYMNPRFVGANFAKMKSEGRRIVSITAYDLFTAKLALSAGVDFILVGD